MGDRCYSTVVCAERDKYVFEKLGYRLEESKPLSADGKEIPGAVVMVDEQANYGHYDELTTLAGIPFLVCGGSCPGAYGDHLIVSDGKEWHHSEALHESNYPAVRVEYGGVIRGSEADDARKYWTVYESAVTAIKRAALKRSTAQSGESKFAEQNPIRASTRRKRQLQPRRRALRRT
jgi:hypothetical protein